MHSSSYCMPRLQGIIILPFLCQNVSNVFSVNAGRGNSCVCVCVRACLQRGQLSLFSRVSKIADTANELGVRATACPLGNCRSSSWRQVGNRRRLEKTRIWYPLFLSPSISRLLFPSWRKWQLNRIVTAFPPAPLSSLQHLNPWGRVR